MAGKKWRGAEEIIDKSSPRNIRYIVDGLIVQHSWPRKDVIEFMGKSKSEDEFKLKIDRLKKLANNFYKELEKEGLIKQFD